MARDDTIRRLLLIDGSGYIFRAFYALPPMTRADGFPLGAVFGFCRMILNTLEGLDDDTGCIVVFDAGRRTFRNDIYPEYKANRQDPPEDLARQFPVVKTIPPLFGVTRIEKPGFEADDIIASYSRKARQASVRVTIVSSDKDLMQLVGDGVEMFDPVKNRSIGEAQVREKFGVGPKKVVDVQALAGDSSDNIPGVPGIGVKTAAELIERFGDLDTLLARAEEIPQPKRRRSLIDHAEDARMSRRLCRLREDIPLPWSALKPAAPAEKPLLDFLEEFELRRITLEVRRRFFPEATPAGDESPPSYVRIRDIRELASWLEKARRGGRMAFDTETDGLDPLRARLVGVSMACADAPPCYVPFGHIVEGDGEDPTASGAGEGSENAAGLLPLTRGGGSTPAPGQVPLKEALALLGPVLEDPSILKVGQNIKFDRLVMDRHGIDIVPLEDTRLLSWCGGGGVRGHSLDAIARRHLGREMISFDDVAGRGRNQKSFDQVPIERAVAYAAEDADVTWRLWPILTRRAIEAAQFSVYATMERPLIRVLTAMEKAGIRVDRKALAALSRDFARRLRRLEADIHRLAGREFTIGSPKQLSEILYREMGLRHQGKGKSGIPSTRAGLLEDLAAEGHELPRRVLEWRHLAKLRSTYTEALIAQAHPDSERVHTSFSMTATSTGRLASRDPNLQNIPIRSEEGRAIRAAFIARKGWVLLSADYSQIELRLLAHVANIDSLKEAFARGLDIHAVTAAQMFGGSPDTIDPAIRRRAKAINFGIIYGISPFGLARQLNISRAEAKAYIETFMAAYPGIRDYMDRTIAFCRERGYVETPFARRCYIPHIRSSVAQQRGFAERAAINAPLQGGAADLIKRAMIRIDHALEGMESRMLLQVHDELVLEVPESEEKIASETVGRIMREAGAPVCRFDPPLIVDIAAAGNWRDAH